MSVIEFDPDRMKPHWSGSAQCRMDPSHYWIAVMPCSGNPFVLQCPRGCGMTGHFIGAAEQDPVQDAYWGTQCPSK